MWIAEGFIPRGGHGRTMEEKAQNFLEELLQRSLVQVIKKSWGDKCKTCRVHDLIREMAIHEAREENFFTVFTKEGDDIQLSTQKVRRAMLQLSPPTNFGIYSNNARSLLIFRPYEYKLNNPEFRLLKVLSIERVTFDNKKINIRNHKSWLEGLIHLRYLGFRYCYWMPFEFLSISFSNLKNLETVDFKGTSFGYRYGICEKLHLWQGNYFLHSLWKVPSLRHVIISYKDICSSFPSKGDPLKNLQTLKFDIDIRRRSFPSIEEMWQNLKAMLTRTEHLISFAIKSSDPLPLLSEGTRGLSCHETIQNLFLDGRWKRNMCALNLEMLPTNLTKLTLMRSYLEEDPMPVLERLQSLTILRLYGQPFVGTKLTCLEGGFPRLQKLELISIFDVSHWDIKKEAMPRLSHLKMFRLEKLQVFPKLQNVPMLRNLELDERLYEKSGEQENYYKIQHIPSVRKLKNWRD
ncbi:Disease resistance protein (CC-NBS-LRR class) family [Rhynchospora pubera]|uniref:Disease resistance protein (CC-NBS-LRR class) family n=1 Tax=Rhynchospora pubera TaxID=906938 RepID=A0AAV8G7A6_9POAL|nr:Disease resistance protein (CC-NBS-LRR class) family [Rhynchospora pubera]